MLVVTQQLSLLLQSNCVSEWSNRLGYHIGNILPIYLFSNMPDTKVFVIFAELI